MIYKRHNFTKEAKSKGWLLKDLMERWEINRQKMSRIVKNPEIMHWDALKGLPILKKKN